MATTRMNEQLVDNLKDVLQQAEELLETTAGGTGQQLKAAREKLSGVVDSLKDEWKRLPQRAGDAARTSGKVIREHPYEAAGTSIAIIAFVAGALWMWQRWR